MDTERWHEVDRLFEAALDRPPEARPAFLDSACAAVVAATATVALLVAGFVANLIAQERDKARTR